MDDKTKYTDWSKWDNIKAELKVDLIILLVENDNPPVDRDEVYKEVFEEAENIKKYNKWRIIYIMINLKALIKQLYNFINKQF